MVEFLALDLVGVTELRIQGTIEPEHVDAAAVVLDRKIRAWFEHADRLDLRQHPQAVEDGQVHWQQGFADMEAWMHAFFQQHHLPAFARKQGGGSGAGRATADHQHVDGQEVRGRRCGGLRAWRCGCGVGLDHPG